MFRDYIQNPIPPLTIDYCRRFARLEGEPDYSLTCLGFAVIKPRVDNYAGIGGEFQSFSTKDEAVARFKNYIKNKTNNNPTYCYYRYNNEDNKDLETIDGFEHIEKVEKYVSAACNNKKIDILVNEKLNAAAIFVNVYDIRIYHLLMVFIRLLFPAIFKENPLDRKFETNLAQACSSKEKSVFEEFISQVIAPYTEEIRSTVLAELVRDMNLSKVTAQEKVVEQARKTREQRYISYTQSIKDEENQRVLLEGLKVYAEKAKSGDDELTKFLISNKELRALKVDGHTISFIVATTLKNWNSRTWATFSRNGAIYNGDYLDRKTNVNLTADAFVRSKENRKMLLDSIFGTEDYALKVCSNYTLSIDEFKVSSQRDVKHGGALDYVREDPTVKSYIPNPHINIYHCLGGYESAITESLRSYDYVYAIEECIASAGSVNLDETDNVFRPFLGWILNSTEKILVRKSDGAEMTPEDVLRDLINQKKAKEKEEREAKIAEQKKAKEAEKEKKGTTADETD